MFACPPYSRGMTTAVGGRPVFRLVVSTEELGRRIAAEVRAEQARQQLTDTAVAGALGRGQQWFNRRKNGDVPFSAAELAAVAAFMGVSVTQFYGGDPSGGNVPPGVPAPVAQWKEQPPSKRKSGHFSPVHVVRDVPPVRGLPHRTDERRAA